jgi:pimeloyl-ACP methyl ester carboxylesterase
MRLGAAFMTLIVLIALFIAGLLSYSAWAAWRISALFPPSGEFVELEGEFEGLRLHYVSRGEVRAGIAPVILIHGASGNLKDMAESLVPALEKETRVVAFDRPGHGWSGRGRHPDISNPSVQARAIRAAASKLGLENPVVLGHSWGASVAAAWALDAPDSISGLLPLAGALYPWPGGVAWYHAVVRTPVAGSLFLRTLTIPGGKLLAEKGVAGNFYPDPAPDAYAERIGLSLLFRPSHFRANSEDTSNLKPHLARQSRFYDGISVPVIVVTGNADYTVSPKIHSYAFHNAVKGSELVKLKGTGHMPHHARRDIVVDALLRLARGEGPRAGQVTVHEDGRVEFAPSA